VERLALQLVERLALQLVERLLEQAESQQESFSTRQSELTVSFPL
jgi:hypothetical protein